MLNVTKIVAFFGVSMMLCALPGCVTRQGGSGHSDRQPSTRRSATQPADSAADQADRAKLSEPELSIWNDPAFRRAFQRSYLAETETEPRVTVEERERMQTLFSLMSQNKLDEAVAELKEIRKQNTNPLFDYTLANIYFQQGELDKAIDLYEQAVDPKTGKENFRRAWANLGKIYVRTGKHEKAIEALRRVIETGGGTGTTYGLLGFAYSKVQKPVPAESAFRKAILLDPETQDWKLALAQSFHRQQRFGELVTFLEQLLKKDPENQDFWMLQAQGYIGLEKPLKAAQNYEMVDALGASSYDSLNMLGNIYVNQELYEMAVRSYIRALELKPGHDPEGAVRAAQVLAARGAYEPTEKLVSAIERVKGDQLAKDQRKDLLKLRARIAADRGADKTQAKVLERIIEIDPMDGEALMLLGKYYAQNDRPEQAKNRYEQAARIDDYEADAKIRLAQLLVKEEKYEQALQNLRAAQKLNYRDHVQDYLEQVERIAKRG
jgi:tetratricopeptide (TPR) repeat protein